MTRDTSAMVKEVSKALGAAVEEDIARSRTLDPRQRGELIVSACEAAVAIERSRILANQPPSQPAPGRRLRGNF